MASAILIFVLIHSTKNRWKIAKIFPKVDYIPAQSGVSYFLIFFQNSQVIVSLSKFIFTSSNVKDFFLVYKSNITNLIKKQPSFL
jgi:hypothetical protein